MPLTEVYSSSKPIFLLDKVWYFVIVKFQKGSNATFETIPFLGVNDSLIDFFILLHHYKFLGSITYLLGFLIPIFEGLGQKGIIVFL